jgi:hypothetical protein
LGVHVTVAVAASYAAPGGRFINWKAVPGSFIAVAQDTTAMTGLPSSTQTGPPVGAHLLAMTSAAAASAPDVPAPPTVGPASTEP